MAHSYLLLWRRLAHEELVVVAGNATGTRKTVLMCTVSATYLGVKMMSPADVWSSAHSVEGGSMRIVKTFPIVFFSILSTSFVHIASSHHGTLITFVCCLSSY